MSWSARPAELHPGSTPTTQAFAFADRVLADEGRTRRAHSFLDPLLRGLSHVLVAVAVVTLAVVVAAICGGGVALVLGLHGVGPGEGRLLTQLGGGGVGLGGAAVLVAGITARRWWRAVRSRWRAARRSPSP